MTTEPPREINIITTYRCNAKCIMCNIWESPSNINEEFKPHHLESLPDFKGINITGGEPFLREDIKDIVEVLNTKTKRIVFSTNGYFTDRIIALAKKYPQVGFRVSLEGLPSTNDELRGLKDGFDHGLRTLLRLRKLGRKDIGFAITVSDRNAKDLMDLYELGKSMRMQFASAVFHNSHYFHKYDNEINQPNMVANKFKELIDELLKSRHPKDWYRAYFNYGLLRKTLGMKRLVEKPCAVKTCFIDPFGDVLPCNGMDKKMSMGNLMEHSFTEIWNSERADEVRDAVRNCSKECWMIGSVGVVMRENKWGPTRWIIDHKFLGKKIEY